MGDDNDRHHHGPNNNMGGGGLNRRGSRNRLEIGGVGRRGNVQGGEGGTSMVTYSAEKYPVDTVSRLFECLISNFLDAYVLSFDLIMTRNELSPLIFSHNFFRRP